MRNGRIFNVLDALKFQITKNAYCRSLIIIFFFLTYSLSRIYSQSSIFFFNLVFLKVIFPLWIFSHRIFNEFCLSEKYINYATENCSLELELIDEIQDLKIYSAQVVDAN